jgi:hypothetical protein
MQPMSHDDAAVAAIGAEAVVSGTEGVTTAASAAPSVTGLTPAGADEVSAQAATTFTAEGAQTLASITSAQEELQKAGAAVTDVAGMYSAIDDGAADTLP